MTRSIYDHTRDPEILLLRLHQLEDQVQVLSAQVAALTAAIAAENARAMAEENARRPASAVVAAGDRTTGAA